MAGIRVNASFYRFEFRVFRVTKEFFDSFVSPFKKMRFKGRYNGC